VQSCYLAVGAAVPWGEAGVGVVATQAFSQHLDFGPEGLDDDARRDRAAGRLAAPPGRRPARRNQAGRACWIPAVASPHTRAPRAFAAAGHLTEDGVSVQANMMTDGHRPGRQC
jgi:hypothetical protein